MPRYKFILGKHASYLNIKLATEQILRRGNKADKL